jgi:hypothetical protein
LDWKQQFRSKTKLRDLETRFIKAHLNECILTNVEYQKLRYIISFARTTIIEDDDSNIYDVNEWITSHRDWVTEQLKPLSSVSFFQKSIPWKQIQDRLNLLQNETLRVRSALLYHFKLKRNILEQEVCTRQLGVVMGGGGGCGYGYIGALQLLHRYNIQPQILAGTSMGALIGMFRSRTKPFDMLSMIETGRRLSWNKILRVLDIESRYGVPATLRLYLRTALGSMVRSTLEGHEDEMMTFSTTAIPLLVTVTGLKMEAFKHDMSYYEHLMDDALSEDSSRLSNRNLFQKLQTLGPIIKDFILHPEALQEIIFGEDEITRHADVIDAAGFSSAIPGLIHYDVLRDDPRMHGLLDELYAEYGITRLGEGGLVNNLPAEPIYRSIMNGKIKRRNPVILSLDCFSPQMSSLGWYPLQKWVEINVKKNFPYTDHYFELRRRLPAIQVVPSQRQLLQAIDWTVEELEPDMELIKKLCSSHDVLDYQGSIPLSTFIGS